ncbi:MAG: hypothetical protein E6240_13955 [Clostridium butyricum]|jgi:adenylate kinase|nr:hypothetical protein [Clostridium butyricum]
MEKYIKYSGTILLDGHFTLIDKSGRIQLISIETFEGLNISCILVIKDDPINIVKRLEIIKNMILVLSLNSKIMR